jgi:hypothetical protein
VWRKFEFFIYISRILYLGIYSMGFVSDMCLNAFKKRVLFSLVYLNNVPVPNRII